VRKVSYLNGYKRSSNIETLLFCCVFAEVMASEQMPKVDPVKDKLNLTEAQLNYMRLAQQQNQGN